MLIHIRAHTSYHSDFVERQCICEKCGTEFKYRYIVSSTGIGISPYGLTDSSAQRTAHSNAQSSFSSTASKSSPHFPCPHCGWYQSWMNSYYRKTRFKMPIILLGISIVPLYFVLLIMIATSLDNYTFSTTSNFLLLSIYSLLLPIPATVTLITLLIIKFTSNLNKKAPPIYAWSPESDSDDDKSYFLSFDNGSTRKGPFSITEIKSMISSNRVSMLTHISENGSEWSTIDSLKPSWLPNTLQQ